MVSMGFEITTFRHFGVGNAYKDSDVTKLETRKVATGMSTWTVLQINDWENAFSNFNELKL